MMPPAGPTLRRLLTIATCALLLAACSMIGRQDPKVFKGQFSPSGKYYAYIYYSVFMTSYQRNGGRTVSSGILTNYFQVIDTETGQKLLLKPLKLKKFDCQYPSIGAVSDAYVLVSCRGEDGKGAAPMVFSIEARTVTLTRKGVVERNPGLAIDHVESWAFYRRAQTPGAFFVEGNDGRKYQLDPQSGIAKLADGEFERVDLMNSLDGDLPKGLREAGETRRFIERSGYGDKPRSQSDFLEPKYLALGAGTGHSEPATLYAGGFLVLSKTVKDSGQNKLLTMADAETLATRWSTPLPQPRGDWANGFDTEQFVLRGKQLLVANSSQLLLVDLDNGALLRNVSLLE